MVAVEPSRVMLGQRPAAGAPAIQAAAEALPLRTGAVEAALAVLTVHHWTDVAAGISEMRRVARDRVIVLTWTTLSSKASGCCVTTCRRQQKLMHGWRSRFTTWFRCSGATPCRS